MAQHETLMGDEISLNLFANPNIDIHHKEIQNNNNNDNNNSEDDDDVSFNHNVITLMGNSTDVLLNDNKVMDNDLDDMNDMNRGNSITLMGNSCDLEFIAPNNRNKDMDDMNGGNSITLMGSIIDNNFKKRNNKIKYKKISSESYWRMFVFQEPQIFSKILSYLLPYKKIHLSNIAKFINQFIVQSQLKYIIQCSHDSDDEKLEELKPIKLKTNWQKYDVIDYKIDDMIWKNQYNVLIDTLNYKSLIIDISFWDSVKIKQLKYFLVNQIKLIKIYNCMEMRRFEDNMYHSNSYEDQSPLSQILDNITNLYVKDMQNNFGITTTIFCSDLLSSRYCKINALYLNNNGLTDKCIDIFCNRLLLSMQSVSISSLIDLDLSDNINITGECIQILFTLIGEKCNSLKYLNLSSTSIDNRVCIQIYDYYRCYYGSSSCNLDYIELRNNKQITIEGVNKLNKIFMNKYEYNIIIPKHQHRKKINLLECQQLQTLTRPNNLDYRILISSQCQQQYIDTVAMFL